MNKQQEVAKYNNAMKVLLWIACLALFAYSFQTIMDLKEIANPKRQQALFRILSTLSKPNLFEGEVTRYVVAEMWETIRIGFLATTMSAVFAIPFAFFSARSASPYGRGFNIILQPMLSVIRAVHPLIITVPAVVFVGLGPEAGVLALTLSSTAVLIGDFTDYAQQHTSLSWSLLVKVHFPGLALKQLSVNTLIATILGFAGGGGIGFFLQQHINLLEYSNASVAILACIIVIGSLDLLGRAVWHRIQSHWRSLPSAPGIAKFH